MLKVFTQHRYLLWQFTKRQIEQRHRGSALGMVWSVLSPLLMMAIYTIVIAAVWQSSGFVMAMFLAGLRGVDNEIIKAARRVGRSKKQSLAAKQSASMAALMAFEAGY